jgi:hypothetical protein
VGHAGAATHIGSRIPAANETGALRVARTIESLTAEGTAHAAVAGAFVKRSAEQLRSESAPQKRNRMPDRLITSRSFVVCASLLVLPRRSAKLEVASLTQSVQALVRNCAAPWQWRAARRPTRR